MIALCGRIDRNSSCIESTALDVGWQAGRLRTTLQTRIVAGAGHPYAARRLELMKAVAWFQEDGEG